MDATSRPIDATDDEDEGDWDQPPGPGDEPPHGDSEDNLSEILARATDACVRYTAAVGTPAEAEAFIDFHLAQAEVHARCMFWSLGQTKRAYAAVSHDGSAFNETPSRWPDAMWPEAPAIWNEVDGLTTVSLRYVGPEAESYVNLDLTRIQADLIYLMDEAGTKSNEDTVAELARIRSRLAAARASFDVAGTTRATYHYLQGMVLGLVLLAPATIVVANVVNPAVWPDMAKTAAACAIAGQFGAAVSVLTRISGGGLNLDYRVGRRMLRIVGFARPVLGAILGSALYFAVIGGLVPLKSPSDQVEAFAFFVAVGFVSGFSERYAQDMLSIRPQEQPKTGDNA